MIVGWTGASKAQRKARKEKKERARAIITAAGFQKANRDDAGYNKIIALINRGIKVCRRKA